MEITQPGAAWSQTTWRNRHRFTRTKANASAANTTEAVKYHRESKTHRTRPFVSDVLIMRMQVSPQQLLMSATSAKTKLSQKRRRSE